MAKSKKNLEMAKINTETNKARRQARHAKAIAKKREKSGVMFPNKLETYVTCDICGAKFANADKFDQQLVDGQTLYRCRHCANKKGGGYEPFNSMTFPATYRDSLPAK